MKFSRFLAASFGVMLLVAAAASAQAAPQPEFKDQCAVATTDPDLTVKINMFTRQEQSLVQIAAAACGTLTAGDPPDWVGVSTGSAWANQKGFDAICGAAFNENVFMIISALGSDQKSVVAAKRACQYFEGKGLEVVYADAYQP